jgi:hypothetical protein
VICDSCVRGCGDVWAGGRVQGLRSSCMLVRYICVCRFVCILVVFWGVSRTGSLGFWVVWVVCGGDER